MAELSQALGLVSLFSDYKDKYGIGDDDTPEIMLAKVSAVNPGLANSLSFSSGFGDAKQKLKQMYEKDKANQVATDRDPLNIAIKQSKEFEKQAPKLKEQATDMAATDARIGLAKNLGDIRQNASSRGLLYSGLRQGAEAGAKGEAASQLAGVQSNIAQGLHAQGQEMKNQAAGGAIKEYGSNIGSASDAYSNALQNYQQRMGNMQQIGGAAGSIAGGYFAGRNKGLQ